MTSISTTNIHLGLRPPPLSALTLSSSSMSDTGGRAGGGSVAFSGPATNGTGRSTLLRSQLLASFRKLSATGMALFSSATASLGLSEGAGAARASALGSRSRATASSCQRARSNSVGSTRRSRFSSFVRSVAMKFVAVEPKTSRRLEIFYTFFGVERGDFESKEVKIGRFLAQNHVSSAPGSA